MFISINPREQTLHLQKEKVSTRDQAALLRKRRNGGWMQVLDNLRTQIFKNHPPPLQI